MNRIVFLLGMFLFLWISVLQGKQKSEGTGWISVSDQSPENITRLLQEQILLLKPSRIKDSLKREAEIKEQEQVKAEKFLLELLNLDGQVSATTFKKTESDSEIQQLKTQLVVLDGQKKAYQESMLRLNRRLNLIPFQVVLFGEALVGNHRPALVEQVIHLEMGKQAIEEINGIELFSKALVRNNILVEEVIQIEVKGFANGQLQREQSFDDETLDPKEQLFGIFDVYPLSSNLNQQENSNSLNLNVSTSILRQKREIPLFLSPDYRKWLAQLLVQVSKRNKRSTQQIQDAIFEEKEILRKNGIKENHKKLQEIRTRILKRIRILEASRKEREKAYQQSITAYLKKQKSEERIDVVNRFQVLNKSLPKTWKTLVELITNKFFNDPKSLAFQRNLSVKNAQVVGESEQSQSAQAFVKAVKILGVYPSKGSGSVQYKASIAFQYGFRFLNDTEGREQERQRRGGQSQKSLVWKDPVTGMEFVLVKGGCFQMGDLFNEGDSDEKPVHEVCLDDFYLGKHEVTQGQWKEVMRKNPSSNQSGSQYPVESVSWEDTQSFIQKLNARGSAQFCLPTEAQWEYAAREGGKKVRFGNGRDIARASEINFDAFRKYAYSEKGKNRDHSMPVGSFSPNQLGLYDMSGNLWEWVHDWYGEYTKSQKVDIQNQKVNSKGPKGGVYRVIRGGSFYYYASDARSAGRYVKSPGDRYGHLGFRLCRN